MRRAILVDGSNLLFWRGQQPDLGTVGLVVAALRARGCSPVVYFDHSITRLKAVQALPVLLGMPPDALHVVARGTSADPLLLAHADSERLQIVSRDRFRQWVREFPQLRADWLVTGRIEKGGRVSLSKKLRRPPS